MKKLIIIPILLWVIQGIAQVKPAATYTNIDSAINAHLDITGALNATSNFAYYQVTQAQIQAIINNIKTSVSSQLEALTFSNPPKPPVSTGYKFSPVINKQGLSNVTFSGDSIIAGNVPGITLTNCDHIRIHGNKIINGKTSGAVAILLNNCHDITIDSCYISNTASGVYAIGCTNNIVVVNNYFLNMIGPYPRGQFIQFDTVIGTGNTVLGNHCENILGQSYPEDAISIYKSAGTSTSPILITGNWIRGGGPSKTGGGINLGDNGGSYLTASNNILVNPGQYGIQISGGDHNSLVNNTVYGAKQSFTNVGVSVWGQAGSKITSATVSSNKVYFVNSAGQQNSDWLGAGSTGANTPAGWSTNTWNDTQLSPSILPIIIKF